MWHERMRDAADPNTIPVNWPGIVAGYLGGGNETRRWTKQEWGMFKSNKKMPIYARLNLAVQHPIDDAFSVLRSLHYLGVPAGKGLHTGLDIETEINSAYVHAYGEVLNWAGFQVHPYGSLDTIVSNPPLNGYWIAEWVTPPNPFMNNQAVMTQYTDNKAIGNPYDSSTVRIALQKSRWWV